MADRAVYLEIGFYPALETGFRVERFRIRPHCAGVLWQRLSEDADMSVGAKLVVLPLTCKLMFAVHLRRCQSQHKPGCTGMTEHTLSAAGIVPHLLAYATCCSRILDLISGVQTLCANEHGVRLLGIPAIRIPKPLVSLLQHDSCLNVLFR